jgi:predicted nucleic acid-binding protein
MVMLWLISELFGTSGMTENRFVLDTNAVIFLTTRGNVIPSSLENDLDEADLFISVITEIELFAKPELPSDEEDNLRVFLADRTSIIDLTNEIKKEVIALRRSTKHKLPDCIVAATAIVLNATLLTADVRLLRLEWPNFKAKNID